MLPEQIQTNPTNGSLKPPQNTVQNGCDNIITISTTNLNECNNIISSADTVEALKTSKSELNDQTIFEQTTANNTSSTKFVRFLSKSIIAPTTATSPSATPTTTCNINNVTTEQSHRFEFCSISQWLSFQDNIADVHHRRGRRLNGLQLPLHPLQVFGWLVLILFGFASFWLLIPSFSSEIQGPLYGLISGLYIVHVASHLAALLIDPADRELRRIHRNDRIVPEFDRNKHTHVIENGRCHLCNIRTSSQRTKHCSVCNKCVGKFDHHCKWLNHCIGSRNYVAFLMCVVSAVIATLVIVTAVIAQIALYFVQPEWLNFWFTHSTSTISTSTTTLATTNSSSETVAFVLNNNATDSFKTANASFGLDYFANSSVNVSTLLLEDDFEGTNATATALYDNISSLATDAVNESIFVNLSAVNTTAGRTIAISNNSTITTIAGIGVNDTIFLVLIGLLGLLAAITAGLLLHLCFFHIYISFLGLTTYEYIRNHRQAQEAKAKNLLSTLPKSDEQHFSKSPSKKTKDCGQIYFCSTLRHPNSINAKDLRFFESRKLNVDSDDDENHTAKLHCCANSREYHQTALKTYYMCSLLEEGATSPAMTIPQLGGRDNLIDQQSLAHNDAADFKTFHCCSTFAAATAQRKVSATTTKSSLVTDFEAAAASLSARRSYMQFTEQCTFCTFRIRSPIVAKRNSISATSTSTIGGQRLPTKTQLSKNLMSTKTSTAAANNIGADHQRCCMKAISKHQRWRRKWNCCSNVPDSPDVPNDIIAALAMRHQHDLAAGADKKINATEIPVHFIKTVHNSATGSGAGVAPLATSPRSANLKTQSRNRNSRTWPVPRLRHMMRMLNRYRRPRCRNLNTVNANGEQIKQNQIRPLQVQNNANNWFYQQYQQQQQEQKFLQPYKENLQQNYYDSSSPQPPSSTTTASERSSDPSTYSDTSSITTPGSTQPNTVETILPTSVIRDDMSMTYTTPVGITLPPALPPPTRRKIPNPTDLEELAQTLGFASHPSSNDTTTLSATQRFPIINNVYRRQRRKHFLRTRSPTLSPIHESGLSNPTSPQPCRHNTNNSSPTPTLKAAANNTNELLRKTSSNNSLKSVSSNSSST
ncbi:uncharacterized protein LOC119687394 [Teleopsis dalmanni]|uniref:uncharacterized protein LOC119687394 n=1 Tax=Teleopsis dalmanni TaxID=139649 RepID=UPI0018CD3900|nr:uncharacterized protein LOC119687394 [Teleopsis dalmanni]